MQETIMSDNWSMNPTKHVPSHYGKYNIHVWLSLQFLIVLTIGISIVKFLNRILCWESVIVRIELLTMKL